MWSDRLAPDRLRGIVDQLRSLPSPSPWKRVRASAQDVERWQSEPCFLLLNGPRSPFVLRQPVAAISYRQGVARIAGPEGNIELCAPAFDIVEAARQAWAGTGTMLAGYLSYDLAAELEDLGESPADDLDRASMFLALYDTAYDVDGWAPSMAPLESKVGTLGSRPDHAGFEAAVARIVHTIHAGDIFQTNLCRRIEASFDPRDSWRLYQRLSAINPARYAAFLRLSADNAVLSASPEEFLKVEGRCVESSPIKGTRPRGEDSAADAALARELLASEKDRAELAMIVDVVRNDLGRVCETGSVEVTAHAQLMTLPTVHHLYSTVTGMLRNTASYVDLLRAAFPAASISGAPKIEAMHVAQREERQLRGPAMGAIGWMTDDAIEFSVAIRTAFTGGGKVRYYAGCGITADSVPASEYQESYHKAAAFVRALTE